MVTLCSACKGARSEPLIADRGGFILAGAASVGRLTPPPGCPHHPSRVARVADAALCPPLPSPRPRAHQLRADRHPLVRPRIYRRHSLRLALCARDHPPRAALELADADDRQRL